MLRRHFLFKKVEKIRLTSVIPPIHLIVHSKSVKMYRDVKRKLYPFEQHNCIFLQRCNQTMNLPADSYEEYSVGFPRDSKVPFDCWPPARQKEPSAHVTQ